MFPVYKTDVPLYKAMAPDIRHRPSERDLQKAEIFPEEKLEEPY